MIGGRSGNDVPGNASNNGVGVGVGVGVAVGVGVDVGVELGSTVNVIVAIEGEVGTRAVSFTTLA